MPLISPAAGTFGTGLNPFGSFPNPWMDLSTSSMPKDKTAVLDWCHYIWHQASPYRSAIERVVSYFITDLEFGALRPGGGRLGDDEKEKWQNCLGEQLHIAEITKTLDLEKMCYGNGFISFIVPFHRMVRCPKCALQVTLRTAHDDPSFSFKYQSGEFRLACPKCHASSTAWHIEDYPDNLEKKLALKFWPAREIEIINSIYTGDCDYIWRIPNDYRQEIRRGNIFELERAPRAILEAVAKNLDFRFAPGILFHAKEPTLSGLRTRGWGIPRTLANWREIVHLQVLRRQNEAIALDYIIPMRLVSPAVRSGTNASQGQLIDPLTTLNAGDFVGHMNSMFNQRRRDPAAWFVSPTPVEYQLLGGEAANLVPREQMDQAMESLLNSAGAPQEMYRGTLQFQAYPMALRLFESTHQHLPCGHASFLRWVVESIARLLNWEPVEARMRRVTLADDFEKNMMVVQMAMGGAVSMTSALERLGVSFKDETRTMAEEARFKAKEDAAVQEEMAQNSFGEQIAKGTGAQGGAPGGGAPGMAPPAGGGQAPPGGGAMSTTGGSITDSVAPGQKSLDEMMSEAQDLSGRLLMLPASQRVSELKQLKQKHEGLHALVKAQLESQRNQAKQTGGQLLLAQQGGATQ